MMWGVIPTPTTYKKKIYGVIKEMYKKSMYNAIVAIAVAMAFVLPGSSVFADDEGTLLINTVVSIQPDAQTVEKGETFMFSVYVVPSEPIMTVAFDLLSFDPTLIQVDSIVQGNLSGDWFSWVAPGIDNINGEITLACGVVMPANAITDPGSFVDVTCHALQKFGTSVLDLEGVLIANVTGVEIPADVFDGSASVGDDTTPPVTNCTLDPPEPNGDNGWYVSNVGVTLNATDDVSGVESTWYRIDDGDWILYNGTPFVVSEDGEHMVEYYSFDQAENQEDTKSVDFKIDNTPPATEHEFEGITGDEGWFVSNVTVTLSADDVTSGVNYTMYKLNDGDWITYVDPFVVTENGDYTIYYYSVDLAGNIEPTIEGNFKIEHDVVPPVTTHDFEGTLGDNDWYTSIVIVTLIAEDESNGVYYTMYKLDDDIEWQEYNGPISVTEDGEQHTIMYYSVDFVGNKEEDKGPFCFKIDQTLPTIELTWDEENSKLIADVSDETSGIARVEFYINGEYIGEVTEDPYEYEVANPKMGDKGQVIVFDNAGNLKVSNEIDAQSQDQDVFIRWTFLIGWISNVEEAENIITAQAIRLRYIEVAPTGITVGFVKMKAVEFSSHNLLGRTSRSFSQISPVLGIFKGGIIIGGG